MSLDPHVGIIPGGDELTAIHPEAEAQQVTSAQPSGPTCQHGVDPELSLQQLAVVSVSVMITY